VVLVSSGQIRKGCRAVAALVRPISSVGVHVTGQLLGLSEAVPTDSENKKYSLRLAYLVKIILGNKVTCTNFRLLQRSIEDTFLR